MILSDREILAALDGGSIRIEPRPEPALWTSTAVDLTLDAVLLRWLERPEWDAPPNMPRPMARDFNVQGMMDDPRFASKIQIDPGHGFPLESGMFVLGFTRELIQLPPQARLAARVEGKSSLARVGVGVHVTAPTIHAGFGYDALDPSRPGRPIQLEIFNLARWSVILDVGMPICQLILEEVKEVPGIGYQGRFSRQAPFTVDDGGPPGG